MSEHTYDPDDMPEEPAWDPAETADTAQLLPRPLSRDRGVLRDDLFVKLEDWRVEDFMADRVKGAALKVYLALRRRARVKDVAWPSNATIGRETGQPAKKVQTYLAALEEAGWISRFTDPTGRRVLHLSPVPPRSPEGGPISGVGGPPNRGSKPEEVNQTKKKYPRKAPSGRGLTPTESLAFEEFWNVYPKHTAVGAARGAFKAALKIGTLEEILDAAGRYAAGCRESGTPEEYRKAPANWLRGECWKDAPVDDPPAEPYRCPSPLEQ